MVKLIDSLDVENKTALIRVIDSIKEDQTLFLNHYSDLPLVCDYLSQSLCKRACFEHLTDDPS